MLAPRSCRESRFWLNELHDLHAYPPIYGRHFSAFHKSGLREGRMGYRRSQAGANTLLTVKCGIEDNVGPTALI